MYTIIFYNNQRVHHAFYKHTHTRERGRVGGRDGGREGREIEGEGERVSEKERARKRRKQKYHSGTPGPFLQNSVSIPRTRTVCLRALGSEHVALLISVIVLVACIKKQCVSTLYLWKQAKWLLSHSLQSIHPKTNLVCNYAYLKI